MEEILVTGAAGFIGFHVSKFLLERGDKVVGLDNVNSYYDTDLKNDRLKILNEYDCFHFEKVSLEDKDSLNKVFKYYNFEKVINLAAQAGVRYSLTHPHVYAESNIVGFLNILEECQHNSVKHLVYASSSSVYGANKKRPFSIHDNVDHPVSLYAASKKANELMAHSYSHLYNLPCTGLRFFTVYGPWGRPDMALFIFTKAILEGRTIDVYNNGKMIRDFTYIDDIVKGIVSVLDNNASPNLDWSGMKPDPGTSYAPYRVYNIGNNKEIELLKYIEVLEETLGKKARKNLMSLQPGDVLATCADVEDLVKDTGFKPNTTVQEGIAAFVKWYRNYYEI